MATLNITIHGVSADVALELDRQVTDADLRRFAVELVRGGEVPGIHLPELRDDAFLHYVVDRFETPAGGLRLYLRPKVPFGGRA